MRYNFYRFLILTLTLILFNVSFPVSAQPITVSPGQSIQTVINSAPAGSTIQIAAGTFNGNISINKPLTLIGAGSGDNPAIDTIIVGSLTFTSSIPANTSASGSELQNFRITGNGNGINLAGELPLSDITLDNMALVGNISYGFAVGRDITNLTILNSNISHNLNSSGNGVGLRIASDRSINGLHIENTIFEGNKQGIYAEIGATPPLSVIDDVRIINTSFINNTEKGIYLEKLSNAVFDGVTMTNNGTIPTTVTPIKNAGLDINLKRQAYSNITVRNSTFTGNGLGGHAVIFKARRDTTPQASLSNVTVENVSVINNPGNGIVFGGGSGNYQYENVQNMTVSGSYIYGNGQPELANSQRGLVNAVLYPVNAQNNWWGCNDPTDTNAGCDPIVYSGSNGNTVDHTNPITLELAVSPNGTQCLATFSFKEAGGTVHDIHPTQNLGLSIAEAGHTIDPSATFTNGEATANFNTFWAGYPIVITATLPTGVSIDYPTTCGVPSPEPSYASNPFIGHTFNFDQTTPSHTLTVTNATYGADLDLSSIAVDNPAFSVDIADATIAGLTSANLTMSCVATTAGLHTGTLSIVHNAPNHASPAEYPLTCEVLDPDPLYGSSPAVGGTIGLDDNTPTANVVVANLAYGPTLDITQIEVDNPSAFSHNAGTFALTSQQSDSFDVTCHTTTPGTHTTTLSIHHNGVNEGTPAQYQITCIIPEPVTPTPEVTAEPTVDPTIELNVINIVDENGVVLNGMVYVHDVSKISVHFDRAVFVDNATHPDSATNPANYILLAGASYSTESCVAGVHPDDTSITPINIEYENATNTASLFFDPALEISEYTLIVCATTSIVSAEDPSVHLNNGVDVFINFTIAGDAPATPTAVLTHQPTVAPTDQPTTEPTIAPTSAPTSAPVVPPVAPTASQPEDLGITELPATGETPLWAELLGRWLGR